MLNLQTLVHKASIVSTMIAFILAFAATAQAAITCETPSGGVNPLFPSIEDAVTNNVGCEIGATKNDSAAALIADNGGIFGITNVFSLDSTDDLPPHVLAYTEKNYPAWLHAPEKWVEPNMATWETFARERTPAPL